MRSTVFLIILLLATSAFAVDTLQIRSSDPVLTPQRWTEFDRKSGLIGGVFDLLEDRDGHIWIATDQGVQRYDGYTWTAYTASDGLSINRVTSLIQTRDGAMWFGTDGGGISRFDPSASDSLAWQTYTTEHGLVSNTIRRWGLCQTRDGTLWAGFQKSTTKRIIGGISRFDPSTLTWTIVDVPILPNPNVRDILQTTDGSIWFSTDDEGVLRLKDKTWQQYTSKDGLAGNDVWQMLEAQDGSFWFTCDKNGICRFDEIATKAQDQVAKDYCLPIKRLSGEIDVGDIYITPNDQKSAKLAAIIDEKTTAPGTYLYRCHPACNIPESQALMRSKLPAEEREAILARIAALKSPRDARRNAPWSWNGTPAAICPAAGPVTIDGDLTEFATATPIVIDGTNPKNVLGIHGNASNPELRAEMKLMYDAENLYIALTVVDGSLKSDQKTFEVSEADLVEILLCSDPALTYKCRGKVGPRPTDRKLILKPTSANGKPIVGISRNPSVTEIICIPRDDGYILEARVPLKAINGTTWKTGDKLRFEAALHNTDERRKTRTRIYWNAEDRKAWGVPDRWGVAEVV